MGKGDPWWKKYCWDVKPDDKINLEVNGKTKFIGSPKEESVLAILPKEFKNRITAFIPTHELEKLVSGEVQEVIYPISPNAEVVVRKVESVTIRRDPSRKKDNDEIKG